MKNFSNHRRFALLSAIIFVFFTFACAESDQRFNENDVKTKVTVSNIVQDNVIVLEIKTAMVEKNYARLRELLKAKPDLNVRDSDDYSLLATAMNSDLKSFEMLLEAGADANLTSVKIGCGKVERCLKPLLYLAFEADNSAAMKLLLQYQADPNAESVLASAVSRGSKNMLNLLLDYHADANFSESVGTLGQTPLFFADEPSLAEILLARHADLNHRDQNGITPLMFAVQNNNLKMTRFFIKKGADVKIKNVAGETVYEIAGRTGNQKFIGELRKIGGRK